MSIHRTVRLYDGDASGLDNNKLFKALQGLAQDNARAKFDGLSISAVTDSTGGTAVNGVFYTTALVSVVKPVPFTNAASTSNAAVQKTAFDASMGKLGNAAASLANFINPYLGELGFDSIIIPSALTITAAVPALDSASTGSTTTGSVDATTGIAQINIQKGNFSTVMLAINRIAKALGENLLIDNSGGLEDTSEPLTLIANAATAASVDASLLPSLAATPTTAEFVALQNNYATAIAFLNRVLVNAEATTITDNSGGTASTALPPTLVALTIPPAFTTVATDCAPKAGFDTQVALFQNAVASLADKMNRHIQFLGDSAASILPLKDLTTGTVSTTIAAEAASLSAVTGTTVCIDVTTATTTLQAYMNNQAELAKKYNEIATYYDLITLTDSTTGVPPTDDQTLVAMPTTATGNAGTGNATMAATAMNTFLAAARNNIATLAAAVNSMIDLSKTQPLKVVASF
jgi:hypothetical protein